MRKTFFAKNREMYPAPLFAYSAPPRSANFACTEANFCTDEPALSRRSSILIDVETRYAPDSNVCSCSAFTASRIRSSGPSMIVLMEVN